MGLVENKFNPIGGLTATCMSKYNARDEREQILLDFAYLGHRCMERLYHQNPDLPCPTADTMAPHFHGTAYDCKVDMEKLAKQLAALEGWA